MLAPLGQTSPGSKIWKLQPVFRPTTHWVFFRANFVVRRNDRRGRLENFRLNIHFSFLYLWGQNLRGPSSNVVCRLSVSDGFEVNGEQGEQSLFLRKAISTSHDFILPRM